jgi:hypothetical protein
VPSPWIAAIPSSPGLGDVVGSVSTTTIWSRSAPSSSRARTALRPFVP